MPCSVTHSPADGLSCLLPGTRQFSGWMNPESLLTYPRKYKKFEKAAVNICALVFICTHSFISICFVLRQGSPGWH